MAMFSLFLLRLCFGFAAGMLLAPARFVTSGYFRNNLYVVLGLSTLAALLSRLAAPQQFWFAMIAGLLSYVGAVCWLYERPAWGKISLSLVALAAFVGAAIGTHARSAPQIAHAIEQFDARYAAVPAERKEVYSDVLHRDFRELLESSTSILSAVSNLSSGLLLGVTFAAMLLGHWYLNSPTMQLQPLRKLVIALGVATAFQGLVSLMGLTATIVSAHDLTAHLTTQLTLFVVLRWCFGIIGVGILAWMALRTLDVPNTQSATGILYVAVIGTFVGETMALLLSAERVFPL